MRTPRCLTLLPVAVGFAVLLLPPLRLGAETLQPPPPTLWLIGDSTVQVGTRGQQGWGSAIAPFFDPARIRVANHAQGGRSSRTFLTSGRWQKVLERIRPGDVVIMQFGHNDAGPVNEKPPVTSSTRARGTLRSNGDETADIVNVLTGKPETVHSYGWYLRHFIETARGKGATAIVCSPVPRKSWSKEGHINRASGSWSLWAREAAEQAKTPFVDLNEIIARGYEALGREKVEPLFADRGTHTSPEGAALNARAVISGLRSLEPNPLEFALSDAGRQVPAFPALFLEDDRPVVEEAAVVPGLRAPPGDPLAGGGVRDSPPSPTK